MLEIEVLNEVYETVISHIDKSEAQSMADAIMSILVDRLSDEDLKSFSQCDKYSRTAYKDYADGYSEDECSEDDDLFRDDR